MSVLLRIFENRHIEQVLKAGLMEAVEPGKFQNLAVFVAVNVEMPFQDDLVLCQRAGLVGAENIHRAEVLDGIEPLHDGLTARHRDRALGEIGGHHHGQHFRRQSDRHGNGKQKGFKPIALVKTIDEKYNRRHHEDESGSTSN